MKSPNPILHDDEDEYLADFVVLNPNWLLNALYVVISDPILEEKQGRFSEKWIFDRWKSEGYDQEECGHLLRLMSREHFELCYKIPHSQPPEYIGAQLLPKVMPGPAWDPAQNLEFQYVYGMIPKGIMPRMIVRLHDEIATVPDSSEMRVCRTSAVLEHGSAQAEVRESRSERDGREFIQIRATGPERERRDLLIRMRAEIERIHKKSFPGIEVDRLIPCGCEHDDSDEATRFFPLDELEKTLSNKRTIIYCSRCNRERPILELLEGVAVRTSPEELAFTKESDPNVMLVKREMVALDAVERVLAAANATGRTVVETNIEQNRPRFSLFAWLDVGIMLFLATGSDDEVLQPRRSDDSSQTITAIRSFSEVLRAT